MKAYCTWALTGSVSLGMQSPACSHIQETSRGAALVQPLASTAPPI
jgi:hypothetical protein